MKKVADIATIVAVISVVVGAISRLTMRPIYGMQAHAFLEFAGVCLLFAIALQLRGK